MEENKNVNNSNSSNIEDEEELMIVEVKFISAKTLKELQSKVNAQITKYGYQPIEQNPFRDPDSGEWNMTLIYEDYDDSTEG